MFFERNLDAEYNDIQLLGDVAKLLNLSLKVKGKQFDKPLENQVNRDWYNLNLEACQYSIGKARLKHGMCNNLQAFNAILLAITVVNDIKDVIDEKNLSLRLIRDELLEQYLKFGKPSIRNLSKDTVIFLESFKI